jgi:N-acyl-D-amino-acid deacylase
MEFIGQRWFVSLLGVSFVLQAACANAEAPPQTGPADPRLAGFDRLMISFMKEHQIPGASLAIGRKGRLVYTRGYGVARRAEKNLAAVPVRPDALFRIASVSKPITAVAVLQLVERGRLRLDDHVVEVLRIKPHLEAGAQVDPRLARVTIRQLLQHTAGWDRQRSFDPMFRPLIIAKALHVAAPAGPRDVIRYMFGRPLDFDPGTRMAYSNFGFCVLGRVIEKVSGQSYESYVRKEVLAPLGIQRMRLGRTLTPAEGEVHYYDPLNRLGPAVVGPMDHPVPFPYGVWYLEAMDAHGGWIASAADLVRFATAFDDPEHCPILRAESIRTMFARPKGRAGYEADGRPAESYYACGWMVRPEGQGGRQNTWHDGALDGSASLMVRRGDGLSWAVIFNTSARPMEKDLSKAIDPLLHDAADAVKEWP